MPSMGKYTFVPGTRGRACNSTSIAKCKTDRVYSLEEERMILAVDKFKRDTGTRFPSVVELYHVFLGLK